MRNNFLTFIQFIIRAIRIVLYFFTSIILLGLLVVLFKLDLIQEFVYETTNMHVVQVIIILVAAILIQLSIIYSLRMLDLLLSNCSNKDILSSENIFILNKMLYGLAAWTIVQFLTFLLLDILKLSNVSAVFNFSLKDYIINLIFIGATYLTRFIISYGISRQEDYDQII